MASKIRVLSDHTINQIAAGEVIENSASVVKELVENSLDAGATQICVEIRAGGRQLIRVTDNGCGMDPDDALLCLERHATSKLKLVDDLEQLNTLGFRGEAVPSIASISKFTLMTRPHDHEEGTLVLVEGGRLLQCAPAACHAGTTIEVKGLFFNVPARRKFQRAPAQDVQEILKMLSGIALTQPKVAFELISDQESLLKVMAAAGDTAQDQLRDRVRAVLGAEFLQQCQPVEKSVDSYSLVGLWGRPTYTRPNRTGQYLILNGRLVQAPPLTYLIREAYGTALPTNRHPQFVLHLNIPCDLVDVNVHPQKREVRLRQKEALRELIFSASGTLLSPSYSPVQVTAAAPSFSKPLPEQSLPWEQPAPVTPVVPVAKAPPPPIPSLLPEPKQHPKVLSTLPGYLLLDPKSCEDLPGTSGAVLLLLNQRAAHQRILFERLRTQRAADCQPLLIPETVEFSSIEAANIRLLLPDLRALGIDIEVFGPTTFIVRALPPDFESDDLHNLLANLVERLQEWHGQNIEEQERNKRLAQTASQLAIRHKKLLSLQEGQSLVDQLFNCQSPLLCPAGRPLIAACDEKQLAKFFA